MRAVGGWGLVGTLPKPPPLSPYLTFSKQIHRMPRKVVPWEAEMEKEKQMRKEKEKKEKKA